MLNHWQNSKLEEIKVRVNQEIQSLEYRLEALNRLKFFPKKDGKDKADFKKNFGFDVGETFSVKRWNDIINTYRYVIDCHVEFFANGIAQKIHFQSHAINEYDVEGYSAKTILPSVQFDEWFTEKSFPEAIKLKTASEFYKWLKNEYFDHVRAEIKRKNEELEKLPSRFTELCNACNAFHKKVESFQGTALYSEAYRLEGSQFYAYLDK